MITHQVRTPFHVLTAGRRANIMHQETDWDDLLQIVQQASSNHNRFVPRDSYIDIYTIHTYSETVITSEESIAVLQWIQFLEYIEQLCAMQGYSVEYNDVSDGLCCIFAQ